MTHNNANSSQPDFDNVHYNGEDWVPETLAEYLDELRAVDDALDQVDRRDEMTTVVVSVDGAYAFSAPEAEVVELVRSCRTNHHHAAKWRIHSRAEWDELVRRYPIESDAEMASISREAFRRSAIESGVPVQF
jgi:hypothetical protein